MSAPPVRTLLPGYPELAPLAAEYGLGEVADVLHVVEDGVPLDLSLDVNSGSVTGLRVQVRGRAFPRVTLTREEAFDRFTKSIRLDVEPQVGDPPFDEQVYVSTTLLEPAVRALLAAPRAREAVAWLLASDVAQVKLDGDGIFVRLPRSAFEPAVFLRYVPPLVALARTLGDVPAGAPRAGYLGAGLMVTLAGLWAIGGHVALIYAVTGYQTLSDAPYVLGLALQVPLFAAFALVTWLVVRGRPRSSVAFLVAAITFGVGCAVHGPVDVLWLNVALDDAPAVERRFRIVEREEDEDSTLLTVEAATGAKLRGTLRFHRSIGPDQREITVKVRPGALGWAWTVARP